MSTTAQEVFNLAMGLIDEVMNDGTISEPNTITYAAKTPLLLTTLQNELIKQGDLFATYEVSNYPVSNMLGNATEYDIKEFIGSDLTVECAGSAKAYYFEVDRVGTIYIEDFTTDWNILDTITTVSTPDGFAPYKGVVTPTVGATRSRIRFSGLYYYRTVNRALFSVPFELPADVPDYRPWIKKTMPNGFKSVNEIIKEEYTEYFADTTYKWEGRRDLYINYYYKGNIRIQYRPVPSNITSLDDVMQVDDVTATTTLAYSLAAHLLLGENDGKASFFNGRFNDLKSEAKVKAPATFQKMRDVYGSGGC